MLLESAVDIHGEPEPESPRVMFRLELDQVEETNIVRVEGSCAGGLMGYNPM